MPVRKIPLSHRSLTGRVASSTSNTSPMFESSLERDLFILLDFNTSVAGFEEQPIRIPYINKQGGTAYSRAISTYLGLGDVFRKRDYAADLLVTPRVIDRVSIKAISCRPKH